MCNLNNNYNNSNTQIELKKYTEFSKLYFPNEIAKKASDIINDCFKNNIEMFINESILNVKEKLIASCKENIYLQICNDCYKIFLNKYFNVLLKAYVNKIYDSCKKKCIVTKNMK